MPGLLLRSIPEVVVVWTHPPWAKSPAQDGDPIDMRVHRRGWSYKRPRLCRSGPRVYHVNNADSAVTACHTCSTDPHIYFIEKAAPGERKQSRISPRVHLDHQTQSSFVSCLSQKVGRDSELSFVPVGYFSQLPLAGQTEPRCCTQARVKCIHYP